MLATGRALMASPRVLLLDEPSMGLAPVLVDSIFDTIRQLHAAGDNDSPGGAKCENSSPSRDPRLCPPNGVDRTERYGRELAENEMVRKAYLGEM